MDKLPKIVLGAEVAFFVGMSRKKDISKMCIENTNEALDAAVSNGLLKGDENNNLNPTGNLKRTEMPAMVAAGYVNGSDGKLNPTGNITREEFAQVMFNLIKTYIYLRRRQ